MKILIGTKNKGKIAKFSEMLSSLEIEYCTPYDIGLTDLVIEETGTTTKENAIIKATAYNKASNLPVLSDDSALQIDEFPPEMQPGIFVHRFKGTELSDSEIIDLYAKELDTIGGESDGAFCVTLCIIDNNGQTHTKDFKSPRHFTSKRCDTMIENFPLRSLIYYKEYGKYMSEMSVKEAEIAEGNCAIDEKEFIKEVLC